MFRSLINRILGIAGRINGSIWDHAPLLQTAPPPPQLGRPTRVPHLRVIEGSGVGRKLAALKLHTQEIALPDGHSRSAAPNL